MNTNTNVVTLLDRILELRQNGHTWDEIDEALELDRGEFYHAVSYRLAQSARVGKV